MLCPLYLQLTDYTDASRSQLSRLNRPDLAASTTMPTNSQTIATGKAVSTTTKASSFTQVSLARLLGVGESGSTTNVSLTLNMSTSSPDAAASPCREEAPAEAPAQDLELARHERARSKKRKLPVGPRGRAKATRMALEPKSVAKDTRLKDFPEQGLKISAGALFCQPCAITLPNIKSSIISHLSTKKHACKLQTFQKQQEADNNLRTELCEYFAANPDEHQASSFLASHASLFSISPFEFVCAGFVGHRGAYFSNANRGSIFTFWHTASSH